jgi:hypothetical protein
MKRTLLALIALLASVSIAQDQPQKEASQRSASRPLPTIAEKIGAMQSYPGFLPFYWDAREGTLWLRIDKDKWQTPFLFYESLTDGVGSNDIGLDRGQPGETFVVHFERSGKQVFLVAENQSYRAVTDDPDQQRAVREAFPQPVLWGFEVGAIEGDSVLVDATKFFLTDVHGVASRILEAKQGRFKVEPSRSAIYLPRTKNFPQNTEVEATLTLMGEEPGPFVRQVSPEPHAVTVREHFSFIQAPAPGFHSRAYDPRSGFFGIRYMDFATPVDQPIVQRYINRHRLAKKDPAAASSEAVKPIIYYVDRAIPEPIRSAVLEGVSWWNQAFTAAGYKDAFQVKLLPEGVDAMDVRYNVVEWVPRSTRGWSIGYAISDPRTGEIINGHVTLDALRIRQVFLIAQGLLNPFGNDPAALARANAMALARIRQLAAHETGHTLGLMHNYAASIVSRASVMDYPPPMVTLGANGLPDVSKAYAVGIGEWDKAAITYGYRDFPDGTNEKQALDKVLDDAFGTGLLYLTDQDARPTGSASPIAHLWDMGSNDVDALQQVMAVRNAALKNLSENAIREHTPMATLEDVLVPVYLYHRYQLTAAAKSIGGLNYFFDVRGITHKNPEIVPAAQQRAALHAILKTISPQSLAVPQSLLDIIPPRPPEYPSSKENFARRTSPVFDSLAPAEAAAEITIGLLLQPERAQRMIEYHAHDAVNPGFNELLDEVLAATWKVQPAAGYSGAIQRTVNAVVLSHLISLAADEHAASQVRALAMLKLDELKKWLTSQQAVAKDAQTRAELLFAKNQIDYFEKNPTTVHVTAPAPPPAGDPIGSDEWE